MKNILKKVCCFALMLLMLAVMLPAQTAEAANACKQISGNSKAVQVFYVNTGSRWIAKKDVVKLTQTKGTMNIKYNFFGVNYSYPPFSDKANDTKKMYEEYSVKVEKLNSKNKVVKTENYTFDSGSLKIKLDKNSTYRITVTPKFLDFYNKVKSMSYKQFIGLNYNHNPYSVKGLRIVGSLAKSKWVPLGWKTHSTWKVSSTKGINDCSFK